MKLETGKIYGQGIEPLDDFTQQIHDAWNEGIIGHRTEEDGKNHLESGLLHFLIGLDWTVHFCTFLQWTNHYLFDVLDVHGQWLVAFDFSCRQVEEMFMSRIRHVGEWFLPYQFLGAL